MDGTLARACIVNLDRDDPPIPCLFNPKEYTFTKQNQWSAGQAKGSNIPQFDFGGGQPATLQMQLFFDTYTVADDGRPKDVRKEYTDAIWQLMMIDKKLTNHRNKKSRPPQVRFQWGHAWSFDAVITSITQRFTLFSWDGTPVRATLDVSFQQIKEEKLSAEHKPAYPKQNPTSGGEGGERVWIVNEGDTLAWIAHKEYGDATRWRLIADANRLSTVRHLTPGAVLEIPNA